MNIGIDFGHYSIKIVAFENDKIYSLGEKRIATEIKGFNLEKLEPSHWVSAFNSLCDELSLKIKKTDTVITSIAGSKVSIKPMTTLEMEESELIDILNFEAKKHIPLDGSDPVVDFHSLGQNPKEIDKIDIILVATTQKIIKAHSSIVKLCGIKNSIFDTDPIALLNCHKYNYDSSENTVDVLINIGLTSSTVVVYGKNQEIFTREITIAGNSITMELMKKLNTDYESSEIVKIDKGVNSFNGMSNESNEASIQISQKNIFSELSDEIRKTLRYYMKSKVGVSYDKFYLSGGSAIMNGLKDFLNTSLNVDFVNLDPFIKSELIKQEDNPSKYAIAFGLALRKLEK